MTKKTNKKVSKNDKEILVAVSGGFDPVHAGHVRMFEEARALGDKLIVILNNDHWLLKKKNYVFMPDTERAEIIRSFRWVDGVFITKHKADPEDMSVCDAIKILKPQIFANGGDRVRKNVPEVELCRKMGIKMAFNVGKGGKVQSSSWLVDKAIKTAPRKIQVSISKKK